MQKIIFLGTDLHNKPSEMASKLVRDLEYEMKESTVLSIQNRKPSCLEENQIIIPRILNPLRKIIQGFLLPFYLLFMRAGHDKIFTFWTPGRYHYFLFKFLKILKYKLFFTVISGYDKDYSSLKFCDKIICQSRNMERYLSAIFPKKKIELVYPWTNLDIFKPKRKENQIIIPSIPYKIRDFKERGVDKIIRILRTSKIKSKIIFRSDESYNYFKNLGLRNAQLINKILDDKELAEIMASSKVVPLIYFSNSPDVPLSAVEGLAAGCAVICTKNLGLSEILAREKCGIIASSEREIIKALRKIFKEAGYAKKARIFAEKYFDRNKNIKKYISLAEN